MLLRDVNLNLLPTLRMLIKTRSVTEAATALDLSQPAVSDALSRLRDAFDDQLLVRIGGRMELTPRAVEMIEPLEMICADIEKFMRPDSFKPRSATRQLVVATSDICGYLMARDMVDLLREEAPGISLHLIDVEHNLTTQMASQVIDFALLPEFAVNDLAPAPLRFIPLVSVEIVAIMRRGHPLAAKKTPLTHTDLARYPHIRFQPAALVGHHTSSTIHEVKFNVTACVGQMLLVPHLVVGSDSIALVPRQLPGAMAAGYPLESRSVLLDIPKTNVGLTWSPIYDNDPAHKWFRTAMISRFKPDRDPAGLKY